MGLMDKILGKKNENGKSKEAETRRNETEQKEANSNKKHGGGSCCH